MRKAGILLPIFSLPSKYGVGSLGKEAYEFVDFLVRTGQSVWQILPVTSTSMEDCYSPYKTNGAFSGNPDLIDIDLMIEDGYLDYDFVRNYEYFDVGTDLRYVDYYKVRNLKKILFTESFIKIDLTNNEKFIKFIEENSFWLDDFCTYMALREINGDLPYWKWQIVKSYEDLSKVDNNEIVSRFNWLCGYNKFLQFLFFDQWFKLKEYANSKKVEIFGDIPIYISQDSSDFYFNREIFLTNQDGEPSMIAGVPPDEFSPTGQCWGNPLYNWEYLKENNFDWWIKRINKSLEMYDILRIDHFRGLESYYCIDKNTEDAMNGHWEKAPGKELFESIKKLIPNANIVAEDLGMITDDVRELLEYTGFPGMKIAQFGFSSDSNNLNLPHLFYKNTVAYTGTHDNMTLAQWLENANKGELEYAHQYLRLSSYDKYTEGFIRAVIGSSSDLAIVPIQDWLDFGGWSRMNTPSTTDFNWKFRLIKGDITNDTENYISNITGLYGRYVNRW